jgi:hypothetical protein
VMMHDGVLIIEDEIVQLKAIFSFPCPPFLQLCSSAESS